MGDRNKFPQAVGYQSIEELRTRGRRKRQLERQLFRGFLTVGILGVVALVSAWIALLYAMANLF